MGRIEQNLVRRLKKNEERFMEKENWKETVGTFATLIACGIIYATLFASCDTHYTHQTLTNPYNTEYNINQ